MSGLPPDPCTGDRFTVEVTGYGTIDVTEVAGLEATVGSRTESRVPGLPRWLVGERTVRDAVSPSLVLTRGVARETPLRDWFDDWVAETVGRRTVVVALLDHDGLPAVRWTCERAYPTRWTGPRLRAARRAVATESLELAHDGVEQLSP
ncbi:phage tail protein [Salinirubellus salinus]|uniref:Phage tail protein n=1 Tax=Salinirubellus salinus TaxID=1364945 RepID=A0A9E7R127_9EURY|nr:phage tail protein [Salinirubellus salinus]UWM53666.1 phage tail protein [Salinirubellus salinus]